MKTIVKHGVWVIILISFIFSGCNEALRSNMAATGINAVPNTFENPEADEALENAQTEQTRQTENPAPETSNNENETVPEKPLELTDKRASRLMHYAQKIMETEGRKLGTACNFYVHRVLQAAGFAHEIFMANEFHLYAKKYFRSYKAEQFRGDSSVSDLNRLKNYLWAYPERTAFIAQWRRPGRHGHIALLERIDDKLVIYQASLGKKTPRKDQTTLENLLNANGRRNLTIFSEMKPK